jgi:hypothetical protein
MEVVGWEVAEVEGGDDAVEGGGAGFLVVVPKLW